MTYSTVSWKALLVSAVLTLPGLRLRQSRR